MGLDWNKLKRTLNPTFDWDDAVQAALNSKDSSLEDVCISYFARVEGYQLLEATYILYGKSLDCREMLLYIFRQ